MANLDELGDGEEPASPMPYTVITPGASPIAHMPQELLDEVIDDLDEKDRKTLSYVSCVGKQWRERAQARLFEKIDMHHSGRLQDLQDMGVDYPLRYVKEVSMSRTFLSGNLQAAGDIFRRMTQVTSLHLSGVELSRSVSVFQAGFPSLATITVLRCSLSPDVLPELLRRRTALRKIEIYQCYDTSARGHLRPALHDDSTRAPTKCEVTMLACDDSAPIALRSLSLILSGITRIYISPLKRPPWETLSTDGISLWSLLCLFSNTLENIEFGVGDYSEEESHPPAPLSVPSLKTMVVNAKLSEADPSHFDFSALSDTAMDVLSRSPSGDQDKLARMDEITLLTDIKVHKGCINEWTAWPVESSFVNLGVLARAQNVRRLVIRNMVEMDLGDVEDGSADDDDDLEGDLEVARRVFMIFVNDRMGELPQGCELMVEYGPK